MIRKRLVYSVCLLIIALIIYSVWRFGGSNPKNKKGDEIPVFAVQSDTEEPTITTTTSEIKPTEPTTEPTTTTTTMEATTQTIETSTVFVIPAETLPEPTGQFAEIEEVIMQYGKGVSVFYKDIVSGDEYFYNKEKHYFIASLIKAPYVMYVYKCVIEKELDMEERFAYKRSHYYGGTGKIKDMPYGTEFTLEELIYYAIRWSDNVAMNMLVSIFSRAEYIEFAKEIGLPHIAEVRSITNGNICAECAAVYIEAIYNFIEEDNQYSEDLKVHMMNTINRMIQADYPVVRKYGWTKEAFHDFAIIYNEKRPYLLAILSDRGKGDFSMFANISRAVERYNNSKMIEDEETEEAEDEKM